MVKDNLMQEYINCLTNKDNSANFDLNPLFKLLEENNHLNIYLKKLKEEFETKSFEDYYLFLGKIRHELSQLSLYLFEFGEYDQWYYHTFIAKKQSLVYWVRDKDYARFFLEFQIQIKFLNEDFYQLKKEFLWDNYGDEALYQTKLLAIINKYLPNIESHKFPNQKNYIR